MNILILIFISLTYGKEIKQERTKYFRSIIYMPQDCSLKTEPGIVSFIEGVYENYPMLMKLGSNKTTIEFYDITNTLIEEINIEGFKKTQIENLLDNRGFYCEDTTLFKEQELTSLDTSFLELFEDQIKNEKKEEEIKEKKSINNKRNRR